MSYECSGGMKKRAGLARAMALDPEILFFDEPSAGLDPVMSAKLDRLILNIRSNLNTTMVIVTHELDSIYAIADRVMMIGAEEKTVIAIGKPFLIKQLKIYELIFVENDDFQKNQKSKLSEKITLFRKFFNAEIDNLPLDNLDLSFFSNFEKNILFSLRTVKRGETISYAELAKIANYPSSYARAVGNLMKKNPFPLFFPCHRVIRSNGEIGEFSAGRGKSTKEKLLFLEQKQKKYLKNSL